MNMKMLSKLLYVIIPAVIMSQYPFIKNLAFTSLQYESGYLIINGTMDVQFTDQAWTEFGYKKDNFYWFDAYWQEQIGNRYGPFELVAITWTLIEHTETFDRLSFQIVLEPRAHVGI